MRCVQMNHVMAIPRAGQVRFGPNPVLVGDQDMIKRRHRRRPTVCNGGQFGLSCRDIDRLWFDIVSVAKRKETLITVFSQTVLRRLIDLRRNAQTAVHWGQAAASRYCPIKPAPLCPMTKACHAKRIGQKPALGITAKVWQVVVQIAVIFDEQHIFWPLQMREGRPAHGPATKDDHDRLGPFGPAYPAVVHVSFTLVSGGFYRTLANCTMAWVIFDRSSGEVTKGGMQ